MLNKKYFHNLKKIQNINDSKYNVRLAHVYVYYFYK